MLLKEYLVSKNISQTDLAKQLNVKQGNVSRWVNGFCRPNPKFMKKIMEWSNGQVQPNDFYTK